MNPSLQVGSRLNSMTLALTLSLNRNWTWPGAKAISSVAGVGAPSFVYTATNGATRIADSFSAAVQGVIQESKYVLRQGLPRQIQDYIDYASVKGYQFILTIKSETIISTGLQKAIRIGEK